MANDPGDEPRVPVSDEPRRRRKLSAIMMADVSGFSRMMGSDEDRTVDRIQDFHRRVRGFVDQFEGRIVDTAGDSVFGEFDSVVNAMSCALQIQQALATVNDGRADGDRIETRIGVHLGDVIVEDYQVYGDGVNIAARLEPIADPGGICISEAVYQQVRTKLDVEVQDLGLQDLKNIQHPIRVFKVAPPMPAEASDVARPMKAATVSADQTTARSPLAATTSEGVDTTTLILFSVGMFLIVSPWLLFSTGGVFPTAGAIVIAVAIGRMRDSASPASLLMALGIAIASGAWWTNWSGITNSVFLLGGLIVLAIGIGNRR